VLIAMRNPGKASTTNWKEHGKVLTGWKEYGLVDTQNQL
jgi:hypothetical protein